jgi:metallo-beta-lactamase family protein
LKITFHGAAREVTGSCHRIETGQGTVVLDCGMIQGGRKRHERNREPFPFPLDGIHSVILSHAHIDHSGRLPVLIKAGYGGPIVATEPTVKLCEILLPDSGRIQEEDARWKIKRLKKKGEAHDWVRPLYTEEDAFAALERFVPVPFDEPYDLGPVGSVSFVKAGHILGAAIVDLRLPDESRRLTFSGDLGAAGARLLSPPQPVECPDFLIMESTYGDRNREEPGDRTELLHGIIEKTIDRGGKVVIPSFAVGRTQEILARINDLVESGKLSGVPVYVDSPMAAAATEAFALHPEAYSEEARRLLRAGDRPLEFPGLRITSSVEESIAINASREPCVIISASGMCTAGRVKHHLKHNLSNPNSCVLFVGYQARGTLGQVIQSGTDPIRIFGEWYPVRARIETIEGFSAHGDRDELLAWFESLGGTPRRTWIVHGEEHASESLAEALGSRFGAKVEVPRKDQSFSLG